MLIDFTFGLAAESLLSRSPGASSCYCGEPARMWFEFLPRRKTPFLLPQCHLSLELSLGERKRRPNFHGVTTSPFKAMRGSPRKRGVKLVPGATNAWSFLISLGTEILVIFRWLLICQ